ncbi:MAG: septum formation initiator family protein [Nitrospirae bacterium]|nr:septum formation initiator family protein [Nitrospirota bacterium]
MSYDNRLRKQVTSEIKKRRLIFFTIVCLSILYFAARFTFGETGLLRYRELAQKKTHLVSEIGQIEATNAQLKTELKLLKENPFYIEKYAREDFGMAKPDEYVFKYEQ